MINDLSELKKLIQLCRKQGITEIKLGEIELKFGEMPRDIEPEKDANDIINEAVGLDPEFEGMDPMAFYSSPRNDQ